MSMSGPPHVGITRGRGWPIIPILGKRRWQDELWTDFEKSNIFRYKKVLGIPQVGYK